MLTVCRIHRLMIARRIVLHRVGVVMAENPYESPKSSTKTANGPKRSRRTARRIGLILLVSGLATFGIGLKIAVMPIESRDAKHIDIFERRGRALGVPVMSYGAALGVGGVAVIAFAKKKRC